MAIKEIKTFKDIQDAIIRRAKIQGEKTEVRDDLKEKINTFYQHISFKRAYSWSGETRPLKLRKKEETGTISVTNGSDVITGSGTAFDELSHVGSKLRVHGYDNPLRIIRVASATELTVDSAYAGDTDSGLGYTIYKDEYGLYPDLQNIRKLQIPGAIRRTLPASPEEVDNNRWRNPFRGGLPLMYTINGLSHYSEKTWATFNLGTDFWEDDLDSRPRNKNLVIWPAIMTDDVISQVRYTKIVEPMGADNDEPLIPYENRRVLVYGPLNEHFLQNRDIQTRREWKKEYEAVLKEMESDVETTDDELILVVDRRINRRRLIWTDNEELASE